jgi:hypothetical protein
MKKTLLTVVALAILVPAANAAEPCLRMDNIYNWDVRNDRTLIVEDYQHRKFKVSLMGGCTNLKFRQALAFKSFGGTGLSCVTRGDAVVQRDDVGPRRCPIAKIELYTPEMQKLDLEATKMKAADAP